MTLRDIENKAIYYLGRDNYSRLEIKKNIISIINKCIDNNIKYDFNEEDFVRVIDIYYDIYKEYNFSFFLKVGKYNISNLDYYKIFDKLK